MNILTTSSKLTTLLVPATAIAVLAAATLVPRSASAKPEFTAQTKLPCGQCHVNPAGGPVLKPFGQQFKDNGNKVK